MKPLPTLVLRADADPHIGLGHLARAVALGLWWREIGGEIVVVTTLTGRSPRFLRDIATVRPPARHPDGRDLAVTLETLADRSAGWVVVDGYDFDGSYVEGLRRRNGRVLQVSDAPPSETILADILLDQNPLPEDGERPYRCAPWTRSLLGPSYALVRPEFVRQRDLPRAREDRGRNVLVLMGGSDPSHQTEKVLEAIELVDAPELTATVVVGSHNRDAARIASLAKRASRHRVVVREDPDDLATLMAGSDVAVSAAGSTCWELCCLGVPSVLLTVASNQRRIGLGLERARAALSLGWHADVGAARIAASIALLLTDRELHDSLATAARDLVDGSGGARVAAVLREGLS